MTNAATLFTVAAIGIVVGLDHLLVGLMLGLMSAAVLIFALELQYIAFLPHLDSQTYANRFANDRVFTDSGPPANFDAAPSPPALSPKGAPKRSDGPASTVAL